MKAGFGTALITPDLPVSLAGFGDRTEPALRVHDDLEARALILDDGERTVCLLVLDLLGMSAGFATPIREAVARVLGIEREAVITSCTHTHQGPNAIEGGEVLGWPIPAGYKDLLVTRCVEAARAARASAEPVTAHAGVGPLPDVSHNRRQHPYAPTFAFLDLRRSDGSRLGSVANVAVHPVAFGSPFLAVSTDWVGPFRAAVQARAGGTSILLSGALGDVNPNEAHTDIPTHIAEAEEEVRATGEAIADAVIDALDDAAPVEGTIRTASRSITVRTEPTMLTGLLNVEEVEMELVEWAIGDLRVVAVPGEAFHALGNRITQARAGVTLLAGLAPTWEGYLPVPYGDGYEESVSLGRSAVQLIADALVQGCFSEVAT